MHTCATYPYRRYFTYRILLCHLVAFSTLSFFERRKQLFSRSNLTKQNTRGRFNDSHNFPQCTQNETDCIRKPDPHRPINERELDGGSVSNSSKSLYTHACMSSLSRDQLGRLVFLDASLQPHKFSISHV